MSARGLLRNGDYLKLLTGQTISSIGSAMSSLVFTLLGLAITGSPVQAGLVGTASALGGTVMSLPGGALVDRLSRRWILISCGLAGTVLYGSVALAAWADRLTLAHLVAVSLLSGAANALFIPAQNAALRQIVASDDLGTALAAAHGRQHVASRTGGPLGGLLYAIGRTIPIAVDAVSYLVMTVLLTTIRQPLPAAEPDGDGHEPMLRSIRTGLSWLMRQPALRAIAAVSTLFNFAATGIMLVLILSMQQRGVPTSVIGLLETGIGVGGLLGAIAAPKLLAGFSTGTIAVAGAWAVVLSFGATAFTTNSAALIVLPSLGIFLIPALNSGLFGYQMLITPDNLQGRAQTAILFLATSTTPLAPVAGGALLETAGARWALLVFSGLITVAALLVTVSRSIRSIPLLSEVTAWRRGLPFRAAVCSDGWHEEAHQRTCGCCE
jgi:predicted MFS family arabinose efflux permease